AGSAIFGTFEYAAASIATVNSVVCGSDTLTVQDHFFDSVNTNGVFTFAKANCTGGGGSIVATLTGTALSFMRLDFQEVTGGGTALDGHAGQAQTNVSIISSGNLTPTVSGDFLYGGTANSAGGVAQTMSPGSGYTLQNSAGTTTQNCALYDEEQVYN